MLLELGKEIDKELVESNGIIAIRDDEKIIYATSGDNYLEPVTIQNNDMALFELLKELSKPIIKKNKTK